MTGPLAFLPKIWYSKRFQTLDIGVVPMSFINQLQEAGLTSSMTSALSALNSKYERDSAFVRALGPQPDYLGMSAASTLTKALNSQPDYLGISATSALSALNSVYERDSAFARALGPQSALSPVPRSVHEHPIFPVLNVVPETLVFRTRSTQGASTLSSRAGSRLEDNVFVQVLGRLNSAFPILWLGANLASMSANPDRVRHVATSLRELVMHVVRTLAPDHVVISMQGSSAEIVNGRPTRASRLRFIFEARGRVPLAGSPNEISNFLRHLDDLSSHTHRVGVRLSDAEVEDLISDTMEHLIRLLPGHEGVKS